MGDGRQGQAPIGANRRRLRCVWSTQARQARLYMMARQLAPCHHVEASLPRLRPPPRLRFPLLDRLSVRAYGVSPNTSHLAQDRGGSRRGRGALRRSFCRRHTPPVHIQVRCIGGKPSPTAKTSSQVRRFLFLVGAGLAPAFGPRLPLCP